MRLSAVHAIAAFGVMSCLVEPMSAQTLPQNAEDFSAYARKLRESALLNMEPQVAVPTTSRTTPSRYPWKTSIVTTVFWIGTPGKNKAAGGSSAWDSNWESHYEGFDDPAPEKRRNFIPVAFIPKLNPFYVALPYNDVSKSSTKPEAKVVIPWFRELVDRGEWVDGQSVCRNRWIAIRNSSGKICYAQWSDCGPFRSDHWQYVFGNELPRPNANGGAGLNVSPAVRDFLELSSTDATDWRFTESKDVPNGPWALYGENNPLAPKNRAAVPIQLAHDPAPPSD